MRAVAGSVMSESERTDEAGRTAQEGRARGSEADDHQKDVLKLNEPLPFEQPRDGECSERFKAKRHSQRCAGPSRQETRGKGV